MIRKIAMAGAALGLAFMSGWIVNGWRADARIAEIKLEQTSQELQQTQQAAKGLINIHQGFANALSNFQLTQQANEQSQADLGKLLLDLRGTTAGLRGDFAELPDRIASAAQPALAEYASTCTAVFEAMAAGGQRLAERGADITRAADGHAADAALTQQAWPK